MEFITLNNATKAPLAGIGTFLMQPAEAEEALNGCLHFAPDFHGQP